MQKSDGEAKGWVEERGPWLLMNRLAPLLAVLFAFLVGAVMIALSGKNPIEGYLALLRGAFGGKEQLSETFVKAIPLLVMGLAESIAFKNAFWNCGGQCQLIVGAVLATWIALNLRHFPGPALVTVCFIAAFVGGALCCLVAGILKARFRVSEVIVTLMMNYIAVYVLMYLIRGPMMYRSEGGIGGMLFPESALVPEASFLAILVPGTRLHAGIVAAVIILAVTWLLWRTRVGFEIEIAGENVEAARNAGVEVGRVTTLVALISGGLAGIVGWNEVFGVYHRLLDGIDAGYGFLGLMVALLGGNSPWGIVVSSLLFAALVVGGNSMERATGISYAVVNVIIAVIILFLLARGLLHRTSRSAA